MNYGQAAVKREIRKQLWANAFVGCLVIIIALLAVGFIGAVVVKTWLWALA